jgi:hypothetical protein
MTVISNAKNYKKQIGKNLKHYQTAFFIMSVFSIVWIATFCPERLLSWSGGSGPQRELANISILIKAFQVFKDQTFFCSD